MRGALLGVTMALCFGGAAVASDFIVVSSSDPAIKRGQAYDAGARVPLAAGATLTVMRASGEVQTLRGSAAGITLPSARLAQADAAKFAGLQALVQPPPQGRTFGARRGAAVCPTLESLTKLEEILKAAEAPGCKPIAREALDAYIAKGGQ